MRLVFSITVLLLAVNALANSVQIRLSPFPAMSVADAKSTVILTAEIRDRSGQLAPDQTQVIFTTTLGTFRESVLFTKNGVVRAELIAGDIPGTAIITASVPGLNATNIIEIPFLADRGLLDSALEYVELTTEGSLMVSLSDGVAHLAKPGRGAHLRYREIQIEADDLQLDFNALTARARKARLTIGEWSHEFEELQLHLVQRKGFGIAQAFAPQIVQIAPEGTWLRFTTEDKLRYGTFEIGIGTLHPWSGPVPMGTFDFIDLSEAVNYVRARQAIVFPRKEIHFHRASVFLDDRRVVALPLYKVSLSGAQSFTDQIVGVSDSQLSLNYPHYLSLRPGQSSLLRFRLGEHHSRSSGVSSGAFMDYELNWNQGDEMQGQLTVASLGRNDMGLNAQQYLRLDERTTLSAFLDLPTRHSVFGSMNMDRDFDGFQMSLRANRGNSLTGRAYTNQDVSLIAEKDPIRLGHSPFNVYFGVTASHSEFLTPTTERFQTSLGLRMRAQMSPWALDRKSLLYLSGSVNHLQGRNTLSRLGTLASASLSRQFSPEFSSLLTYSYTDDGLSSNFLGRQRVSLQANYADQRAFLSVLTNQSLDVDQRNLLLDFSYRIGGPWRLSYSYTLDEFGSNHYTDYTAMLGYTFYGREIGLSYSLSRARVGIQILGASF